MRVEFVRSGERTYYSVARRADGVSVRVPGAGRILPLPHDLVHFVVERELGLRGGFWGSVADGVLFAGMSIVSGRQRPHAAERSHAVMRANTELLLQAEVVAGAVDAIAFGGADADVQRSLVRLREEQSVVRSGVLPLDAAGLRRVCAALRAAASAWQALPLGEPLALAWTVRGAEHGQRPLRDRRRGQQPRNTTRHGGRHPVPA